MEGLIVVSLVAGILTVAAPCVLPLLPVIIGGSIVADDADPRRARWRPYVIVASLAISVVAFTLLLKATTALLGIPTQVWQIISGVIVILLGINLLFPAIWESLSTRLGLGARSNRALDASVQRQSVGGDILTGAALGPVFSSCSPTYALIVATVLPVSFAEGLLYVTLYAIGLAIPLLLVALAGRSAARRLGWLADPRGWFRRTMGVVFVIVGIAVIVGGDKALQTLILDLGWYDPIADLEGVLRGG
ncbi:MAG: sulfite exporter TauE/SafE family protein [Microcella sp.]|uniref:cytochrome c biogenesis CcdA family protein n=1 Tax=Microcella sp. TaxID=1913979 RepID=UPI0024C9F820|nr:cytochrome c biogenesis protein CcdA [Microcella sp.]UYN82804.1 MAG: sulfite exporter TauE/SafE family protein [Microcella sp.]